MERALLFVTGALAAWHLIPFLTTASLLASGALLLIPISAVALAVALVRHHRAQQRCLAAELHEAHASLMHLLAQHLKVACGSHVDRSRRILELCQAIARRLRLSEREVEDLRVAALLQDIANTDVTTRAIQRAARELRRGAVRPPVDSEPALAAALGNALCGALPLLLEATTDQSCNLSAGLLRGGPARPLATRIVHTVRDYDALTAEGPEPLSPLDAVNTLRTDTGDRYYPAVLHALEEAVLSHDGLADRITAVENLLRLGQ